MIYMNKVKVFQYLLLIILLPLSVVLILLSINNVTCVNIHEGRGIDLEMNIYIVIIYSILFNIMIYIRKNNWMKYILLVMIASILIVSIVNYCTYPFADGCYDSNSLTLHYFGSDPPRIVAGVEDYFINLTLITVLLMQFLLLKNKK